MKTPLTIASLALMALVLNSCDNKKEEVSAAPAAEAAFASYFVTAPPAGAVPVGEARKAIGDKAEEVIVEGMLVNNGPVFHTKSAMFYICDDSKIQREGAPAAGGETAPSLGHSHVHADGTVCTGDHGHSEAEGEFDWCCTDPAVLKNALLSVQIVDESGAPIQNSIKGINGLTEKTRVIIKGKPAPTATAEAPLLNATMIYVVPAQHGH